MPAFDVCHEQVVRALEKDGWQIISESRYFRFQNRTIFVDVEAQRNNNGQSQQILLAEIKCFSDEDSTTHELYTAIGQYLVYKVMLDTLNNPNPLYLTIPKQIYDTVFDEVIRKLIMQHQIKLMIVNLDTEAIEEWIE